jgi:hypothetical protein
MLIVDELTAATTGLRKRADFGDLVGKWTPDPEFDEILAGQRHNDPDKWKCLRWKQHPNSGLGEQPG